MVKREQIDQLRCEITVLPTRHYNAAARAIELAQDLINERDNVIALAKSGLISHGHTEKSALALIFSRLHGGSSGVEAKIKSPYEGG